MKGYKGLKKMDKHDKRRGYIEQITIGIIIRI
jgi:hypothetical protein